MRIPGCMRIDWNQTAVQLAKDAPHIHLKDLGLHLVYLQRLLGGGDQVLNKQDT